MNVQQEATQSLILGTETYIISETLLGHWG